MPRKTKMNSITSPELLAQINPENMQLKNDFLEYLRSIQRSPGTIAGYCNDLDIFFVWVMQHAKNKPFYKITKRDIIAYQGWLIGSNQNSPARVRRLKAALSSLSNYCENILSDEEEEYTKFRSIVRKIENPALIPVREKTVWNDAELLEVLEKLVEKKRYDVACFLALAMYSGRRKSEICRFRVSDFDDSHLVCGGALYKSSPILTKGGRYLECYTLVNKFRPYFDLWMRDRVEKGVNSEWLFPSDINGVEHIGTARVNSWMQIVDNLSGKDAYAHSLRHFFCSELVRAGIPDSVIIDIIGWKSADMLRIYDDTPKDDKFSMYFGAEGIKSVEKKDLADL